MKNYSSTAVSQTDIQNLADGINAKQSVQINQLRIWLAVSFFANAALTLVLTKIL